MSRACAAGILPTSLLGVRGMQGYFIHSLVDKA